MSRKARLTASRRRRRLGRDTDSDTYAFGLPLNDAAKPHIRNIPLAIEATS